MKILHVIPYLGRGGAEILAINICNEIAKRQGLEVKIFTLRNCNDDTLPPLECDVISQHAKVVYSFRKKHIIEIDNFQKVLGSFLPDIIHAHLLESELICMEANTGNATIFTHLHGENELFNNFSFARSLEKETWTNMYSKHAILKRYFVKNVHFIAVSNYIMEYYRKRLPTLITLSTTTILYNAINFKKFEIARKTIDLKKPITFINVARFIACKNQQFLVDVAKELKAQGLRIKFLLIGYGPEKENIEKKIMASNLENEVILLGQIGNVEDYLAKSDIYLHSGRDGVWGISTLEALASGLPFIGLVGNADGREASLKNNINGFLLANEDAVEFSRKILLLINNEELQQMFSINNVNYARQNDISIYTDNLLKCYKVAMEQPTIL